MARPIDSMKNIHHYLVATAVFFIVLAGEIFLAALFIPQVSNKEFHDFMLVSMGLAFIPFFVGLLVAVAILGVLVLIAGCCAALFIPRRKVTIGEIAARKAREKRP